MSDTGKTDSPPIESTRTVDDAAAPAAPAPPSKPLTPAAERALAEAAARRAEIDRKAAELPAEYNGRGGLEPGRYGDWEINGIACDF